jgi:hypothetical protein
VAGVGDGSFGVAYQSALFGVVPETGVRPSFFAVNNLCSLALCAAGGPVAEWAMRAVGGAEVTLGGLALGRYHLLFAASAVTMLPSALGALCWPGIRRAERRAGGG